MTFREYQQGITGLLLNSADERDYRKRAFTHVTIERLPSGKLDEIAGPRDYKLQPHYDERRYRITWWRPGAGRERSDRKHGEEVKSLCDELQLLQWISENGLEPLYEIPCLLGYGFLPLRDEDRERANASSAMVSATFGISMKMHEEHGFHRNRVLDRCLALENGNEEAALERYYATKIGAAAKLKLEAGSLTGERFFYHSAANTLIAIHNWPGYQVAIIVDLNNNEVRVGPIEVDGKGLPFYEQALATKGCIEINRHDFRRCAGPALSAMAFR